MVLASRYGENLMALELPHVLTEKLGPLPAWGWAAIGVGVYVLFFRKKSSPGSQGISYVMSYVPQSSGIPGASGGDQPQGPAGTPTPPTVTNPPKTGLSPGDIIPVDLAPPNTTPAPTTDQLNAYQAALLAAQNAANAINQRFFASNTPDQAAASIAAANAQQAAGIRYDLIAAQQPSVQSPIYATGNPYLPTQVSPNVLPSIPSWAQGILGFFRGVPVFNPQPQYTARNIYPGGNPFGPYAPPQIIGSQTVPSRQFGSDQNAFRVAGHYIGDPNGSGAVWVPGVGSGGGGVGGSYSFHPNGIYPGYPGSPPGPDVPAGIA